MQWQHSGVPFITGSNINDTGIACMSHVTFVMIMEEPQIRLWPHKRHHPISRQWLCVNSLIPGRFEWNFRPILQQISVTDGCGIPCDIAHRWMLLGLSDDDDINISAIFCYWWLRYILWNCPQMNVTGPYVTDDESTLVQVMAWCLQAPSHYLSQCWPRSMPQYGITRPQWVDTHCWFVLVVDASNASEFTEMLLMGELWSVIMSNISEKHDSITTGPHNICSNQ